jgi:hypothetical protein
VLAAALAATGCASVVSGHGSAAPPTAPTSASSSPDFPSYTPSTPVPVTSVVPTMTAPVPSVAKDITDVHYRIPKGFVKSRLFHPVKPLENSWQAGYLVPSNERRGLDVLSILLYRLPSSLNLDTIAAQKARVRLYNRRTHAVVQSGLHLDVVASRPAIQENAVEARIYRYAAWYIFSRHHLVLIACQVDQQVNKIARGCQSLLNSLRLT